MVKTQKSELVKITKNSDQSDFKRKKEHYFEENIDTSTGKGMSARQVTACLCMVCFTDHSVTFYGDDSLLYAPKAGGKPVEHHRCDPANDALRNICLDPACAPAG